MSVRTVRIIFVVTVLWVVMLQYVLFGLWCGEIYPALALPGFPAKCPGCPLETGEPTGKEPTLRVLFADGHTQEVPVQNLMPPGPKVRLMVVFSAFEDDSVRKDPNAVNWFRSRIAELFPGEPAVGADILWRKATYKAADPSKTEYQPLHTTRIVFGPST
ncbi:hypothetical protein QN239_18680 [Mycolicibacterium sp. Y3]